MIWLVRAWNAAPTSVSDSLRVVRCTSLAPRRSSRRVTIRLTPEALSDSSSAARA